MRKSMKYFSLYRILSLLLSAPCLFPLPVIADEPLVLPPKERLHIYLLMGQSNMAGRGSLPDMQPQNPRILTFTPDGKWSIAKDPLHQKDGRTEPGVGPSMSFASEMLKSDPDITIALVPCAVGGSPLKRWVKGGDLYARALERAKLASDAGVIQGVLWHQGESDSDKEPWAKSYEQRLSGMFKSLRDDLGKARLPVVVGQLGEFMPKKRFPHVEGVRAALRAVPKKDPNIGFVDSEGLADKGDKLHFSTEAQQEMGRRYAKAMTALHKARR